MRILAGKSTPAVQETASVVVHVIEGTGKSIIGGKTFAWKQGDTFCIPAWHEYQHHASNEGTVYLYTCHDQPMLKSLGFYRTKDTDIEALASN